MSQIEYDSDDLFGSPNNDEDEESRRGEYLEPFSIHGEIRIDFFSRQAWNQTLQSSI